MRHRHWRGHHRVEACLSSSKPTKEHMQEHDGKRNAPTRDCRGEEEWRQGVGVHVAGAEHGVVLGAHLRGGGGGATGGGTRAGREGARVMGWKNCK